ncbi:MAG: bifunctional riboflavin kinase/FAD synthetase [Scytolyngbya sp. HA4215-MV1]|nr:bifunctional riboflavin kinase/FAD synthetase [Scytolyngbya sp. HA4215-MV1]
MWITHSVSKALTPTTVALGNFDGLHLGHRQVIRAAVCSAATSAMDTFLYPSVVTFNPHPQEFFTGQRRTLLTPLKEKVEQLREIGISQIVLLPFDHDMASLNPHEFVEKVLIEQLKTVHISIGQDFCFGRQRAGTAQDLQAIAALHGVEVSIVALQTCNEQRISSSAIRQALQQGDLALANRLLGRPYSLVGQVVKGQQLGRTIGFPTANLQLPPEKFLPQLGVYGVWVEILEEQTTDLLSAEPSIDRTSKKRALPAVMNLGYRPTVNGRHLTAEVYLLDWQGDLYGKTLDVKLESFLRPEQKFSSLEALKTQIRLDCSAARKVLELS